MPRIHVILLQFCLLQSTEMTGYVNGKPVRDRAPFTGTVAAIRWLGPATSVGGI